MSAIYLILAGGVLDGPITLVEVPGIGCQVPDDAIELPAVLAAPPVGFAWALVSGAPALQADHRGTVYRTATGDKEQHVALGDLPEGVTAEAWPGRFYVWGGDGWVIDDAARIEAAQVTERAWRNAQISVTDYLAMPDYPISADQRTELYAYRQALRNWPEAGAFPEQQERPQQPGWIAAQAQ